MVTLRHLPAPLLGVVLLISIAVGPARGMNLYSYDLDSLLYMASDVVEGELTRSYRLVSLDVVDIKVTQPHIGSFREGQTIIVAATGFFCKPVAGDVNAAPLAPGDKLFLFLTRARSAFAFEVPDGHQVFMPVPSGLKLVADGNACGFSQHDNPGPYVADTPASSPQRSFQTVPELRESIKAGAVRVAAWRKQFAAAPDAKDTPWLLALLKERSVTPEGWAQRDAIAETASARLADLHDPESLYAGLWASPGQAYTLFRGFGTPDGREFLLKRIADASEPRDRRLVLAQAIGEAGEVYRSRFDQITAQSWHPQGEADQKNSSYLTRVAQLAAGAARDEELTLTLLRALDQHVRRGGDHRNPQIQADLDDAANVLREFYRQTDSQAFRYRVETVSAGISATAYEKLESPCGPVLSLVRPADTKKYTKPEVPSLIFEYELRCLADVTAVDTVEVILAPLSGAKPYAVQSPAAIKRAVGAKGSAVGGSDRVPLPKDLAPGQYRVFFRFSEHGKTVSEGHGFEITF